MQTFFNIWLKFYFRIWMISIQLFQFICFRWSRVFKKRTVFFFSWVIINSYYYVNFRCRAWFNICTQWKVTTTASPATICHHESYKKIFFLMMRAPRIHSLGNRSEWFLVNAFRMTNAINLDFLNHRYLIMFSYSGN